MTLYAVILAAWLLAGALGYRFLKQNPGYKFTGGRAVLYAVMAVGLAVRLVLAARDYAFAVDINCFKAWAECTAYYGLNGMYHSGVFLDYPPGYMYVLALTKLIQSVFAIEYDSALYTFIIKLPSIIADMAGTAFVYKIAEKHSDENTALFAASLFSLCPATIYNSAVWGQIDSFYTLLLVASLWFVYNNQTVKAAVVYAVALITKPQALLFGPVLLFYIIERKEWKEFFKAVGTGLGCMYVLQLPFSQSLSPLWLVNLYRNTFGGYRYFTINGFNIYMLADLNWKSLDKLGWSGIINPVVIGLCFVLCMWGYFRQKDRVKMFSSAFVFITVFFTFCTMMHERYMHPAIILALVCYVLTKKGQWLVLFMASAGVNYLNVVASMRSQCDGMAMTAAIYKSVSIAVIALCCFALWVYVKESLAAEKLNLSARAKKYIPITAITVFYTLFAFMQLGDTQSPQTYYQSLEAGQEFTVNFGRPVNLRNVWTFSGMGDEFYPETGRKLGCDFEILYSAADGTLQPAATTHHEYVFTWRNTPVDVWTDSVTVRATKAGQVMNEIIFTDENGSIIYGTLETVPGFDYGSYTPYSALDESHLLPRDTGYYSSMYFDEIYHARTAFEQLKGYSIYETTHPPLGKIIISIGIALLGMTPFGWRFMGTVSGVVMVVLMYLLAKELLGDEKISLLCAFIFAFDFMHYTQTRLATVDSFLVMFVMLMFLFMLRWAKLPLTAPKEKAWPLLFFSGVFMGCAVAVKWNGAYGAAGLAVYFFISLWLKYRAASKENAPDKKQHLHTVITTCCACVVFFVVIPFLIYFASFGPVLNADGIKETVAGFVNYQIHMFNYHSQLVAEHFFSSMWYTWPVMIKPIWYSVTRMGAQVSTISAFGNPLVWLPMVPCMVYVLINGIRKKDSHSIFLLCGYLGCYLPWVLVTRLAFIYHYFPATVFGVLAIGCRLLPLKKKLEAKGREKWLLAYPLAVFVLFVVFLPVISGVPTTRAFADSLELLPTWYFN